MRVSFFALALVPLVPALAADAPLSAIIHRALKAQGEMIRPDEYALVRRKCGLPAGTAPVRNLNMTNGALHCPDGRTVRDGETVALSDRIGRRANTYAQAAINDPEVKAAIDRYASERTRAALRRIEARQRY